MVKNNFKCLITSGSAFLGAVVGTRSEMRGPPRAGISAGPGLGTGTVTARRGTEIARGIGTGGAAGRGTAAAVAAVIAIDGVAAGTETGGGGARGAETDGAVGSGGAETDPAAATGRERA